MQNNLNRMLPAQSLGSSRFSGWQGGREEDKQRERQGEEREKREEGGRERNTWAFWLAPLIPKFRILGGKITEFQASLDYIMFQTT